MVDAQEVTTSSSPSPFEERLMDAEEIEQVAKTLTRPTARMQLEALAKKLRKEAAALKVVESQGSSSVAAGTSTAGPSVPAVVIPTEPPKPLPVTPPSGTGGSFVLYSPIDRFSFDAGGYNEQFVTLYIPLPGVGGIPRDQIQCDFEKASFDLIVKDLGEKSYRLKKDCLEHDIVPDKSKIIIKADKINVKLAKIKSEYGSYDYWSKLTDTKRTKRKADPAASITELMKDMYESGDDNMRKMIGETMMKQQRGELGNRPGIDDL